MGSKEDEADNLIIEIPGDIDEEIETYLINTEMMQTEFDDDQLSEIISVSKLMKHKGTDKTQKTVNVVWHETQKGMNVFNMLHSNEDSPIRSDRPILEIPFMENITNSYIKGCEKRDLNQIWCLNPW